MRFAKTEAEAAENRERIKVAEKLYDALQWQIEWVLKCTKVPYMICVEADSGAKASLKQWLINQGFTQDEHGTYRYETRPYLESWKRSEVYVHLGCQQNRGQCGFCRKAECVAYGHYTGS